MLPRATSLSRKLRRLQNSHQFASVANGSDVRKSVLVQRRKEYLETFPEHPFQRANRCYRAGIRFTIEALNQLQGSLCTSDNFPDANRLWVHGKTNAAS